ncbi:hypothetical protein J1N35_021806 [Gossypium stocksii]|uniref:DUF4283 domain-containing protein n=1 Tax=Gossypium stocksii TaxID=47602 RepID=A0A9D4A2B1_9ROSI|nr:hypothetical protein J1N35_021806 [Gossypium stocksii]
MVGKKTSGDFGAMEDGNELALLEEELIHLLVKSSLVVTSENPTLICSVWMRKTYNPESLRVELRSIWKTKKKFEILVARQNLFIISFKDEDDLEQIMDGRPWFFRKQLIIFDRLLKSVERNKIQLVYSLFWLKVVSCPPKCDKKDLMRAVGFTFGGVIQLEIKARDRVKAKDDLPYSAIRRLQHTLKFYKPQLVFLMETKLDHNRMECVRRHCGFHNGLDVSASGSRGGATKDERQMEELWKALADCDLIDMGYMGKSSLGKGKILRIKILEKNSIGEWRILNG